MKKYVTFLLILLFGCLKDDFTSVGSVTEPTASRKERTSGKSDLKVMTSGAKVTGTTAPIRFLIYHHLCSLIYHLLICFYLILHLHDIILYLKP